MKHIERKRRSPERPSRNKDLNDLGNTKLNPAQDKRKPEVKNSNNVLKAVKETAKNLIPSTPRSGKKFFAPKPNVKLTKNINNNDLWKNANVTDNGKNTVIHSELFIR